MSLDSSLKTRMVFNTLAGLACTALATTAYGEPATYDQETARGRDGGTFGVALHTGHMGCETEDGDDCGDGVAAAGGLSLHGGFMIGPRLAILGELWGMAHRDDEFTVSQGLLTGNVRAWLGDRLWLQGGVGVARSKVRYDGDLIDVEAQTDTVPAFALGLGVELISAPSFALDLQLKGGRGFYDGDVTIYNVGLGVGVSWY